MVLAVGDARQSAGWLLPILCGADLIAVWYWRKNMAAGRLFAMAPWVIVGMILGAGALAFPENVIRRMIAVIVTVMFLLYLRKRISPNTGAGTSHPIPYGVAAGFTTTVANAAGPVMNLYLLGRRLPKEEFVATGAWFFFIVNLSKVPIYQYHGLFSRQSLAFNALMIPVIAGGALAGRWMLHRIPTLWFERAVITLTGVSIVLLFK
jgi:hypothetical protein